MASEEIEATLSECLPVEIVAPDGFELWLLPWQIDLQLAAQAVWDDVEKVLGRLRVQGQEREGAGRRMWELRRSPFGLTKTIASIRSKIGRDLLQNGKATAGRMSLGEVEEMVFAFPDLGRFRIVCDLSSDVSLLMDRLLGEGWKGKKGVSLLGKYDVYGMVKDDVLDLARRKPSKGHRARQFAVRSFENGRGYLIEIQVMTLLQDAWDRRNHPIFEHYREGGALTDRLIISDVALADTLFVVDEQASRNWSDFLKIKKGPAA